MERLNIISQHLSPNPTYWVLKNVEAITFPKFGNLKGKTIVVSGGSRGIGLAIAKKAAEDGANIAILAKTTEPHPKLAGTIFTAAAEIEKAGGKCLPIQCDIRFESQVTKAISQVVEKFGGIDILVNNASAISLTPTTDTNMKSYDLMYSINSRGTFLLSKICAPYLLKSENPHILTLSPPFNMNAKWFAPHVAYTIAKYGMSMVTFGLSEEYKGKIGVNCLWPKTSIATAAVKFALGGDEVMRRSRKEDILADAAYIIFTSCAKQVNGNFFMDDEVIGPMDLKKYNVDPSIPVEELMPDFFVD